MSTRLATVLAAALAVLVRVLTGPHAIDDAYITFRYARNLAEGSGLVYNAGEWVLGTTTPIWAGVLALAYGAGATDLPRVAVTLSAVCDGVTAGLLVALAARLGWQPWAALLVGVAWALNPLSVGFASGGMEASLFTLLTLGALTLVASARGARFAALAPRGAWVGPGGATLERASASVRGVRFAALAPLARGAGEDVATAREQPAWRGAQGAALAAVAALAGRGGRATIERAGVWRWWRAGVAAAVAGVSVFVRPEGMLTVGVVVGWTLLSSLNCGWRGAVLAAVRVGAIALAPVAMGALVLLRAYGSPIPHSMAAKQVAYVLGSPFDNVFALLFQAGLPGWTTSLLGGLPAALALPLVAFGLVTLAVLLRRGLPRLAREGRPWQPYAAFAVLYLAFYTLAGVRGVRLFPWYLVPLAPFYLLGAAAGLRTLARSRRMAVVVAAGLVAWQLPAIDWHTPLMPVGQDTARETLMLDVGHQLGATLPSTAVVAAPEIGAVGYASGLRVLDTVGLVSPEAVPYYPLPAEQVLTDNAIPPRLILDRRPDVVVTLDAFAQRSLLTDPAFGDAYRLEQRYPVDVWQSHELLMFRRADLVAQR